MEPWHESFVSWLADNIVSAALGFVVAAMIGFLFGVPQFRKLCARIDKLEREREQTQITPGVTEPPTPETLPATVDYIGAGIIVDAYLEPATRSTSDIGRNLRRTAFLTEFDKVSGAKLGEYEYNRARLHEWMRSNAARFLVENLHDMR